MGARLGVPTLSLPAATFLRALTYAEALAATGEGRSLLRRALLRRR